ncbi:hypothetical protein ABZ923_01000 [Streptomyces sp. NPDC046881]|uniref:hypothetical protein n=1 Tax=Streptomyces sp. NPDC046881 TaxID=3155374 RepID=UPI0033F4A18F
MTDETEPQPTPPALSADEQAQALRDRLKKNAESGEDRPLGSLKGKYRPADRPTPPSAPPTPPTPPPPAPSAPPTPPPGE